MLFEGDWQTPGVAPAKARETVMSREAFEHLLELVLLFKGEPVFAGLTPIIGSMTSRVPPRATKSSTKPRYARRTSASLTR